jgi:hypothetical protein
LTRIFIGNEAAQPHIEPDPPVAEGEGGSWGKLGSGSQMFQVKPGGSAHVIVGPQCYSLSPAIIFSHEFPEIA